VWTEGHDEEALSRGVYNTYTSHNLRYSQVRTAVLSHTFYLRFVCHLFMCGDLVMLYVFLITVINNFWEHPPKN